MVQEETGGVSVNGKCTAEANEVSVRKSTEKMKGRFMNDRLRLTRMSRAWKLAVNQAAKALMETGSATSRRRNRTWSPSFRSVSTACSPLASSLAVNITVSSDCANRLTRANPIPLLAPVTTATVFLDHHLHGNRRRKKLN